MMVYTQEWLIELEACGAARKWASENLNEGDEITREILLSTNRPDWVWWLGCRLDDTETLVWLAPNIAFRETGVPELVAWSGKINKKNYRAAAYAADAYAAAAASASSAYAAAYAAAAYAAAAASASSAYAAAAASASSAAAAAYASDDDTRSRVYAELQEAALKSMKL